MASDLLSVAFAAPFLANFALRYSYHGHNCLTAAGSEAPFRESKIFNAKFAKGAKFRHGF